MSGSSGNDIYGLGEEHLDNLSHVSVSDIVSIVTTEGDVYSIGNGIILDETNNIAYANHPNNSTGAPSVREVLPNVVFGKPWGEGLDMPPTGPVKFVATQEKKVLLSPEVLGEGGAKIYEGPSPLIESAQKLEKVSREIDALVNDSEKGIESAVVYYKDGTNPDSEFQGYVQYTGVDGAVLDWSSIAPDYDVFGSREGEGLTEENDIVRITTEAGDVYSVSKEGGVIVDETRRRAYFFDEKSQGQMLSNLRAVVFGESWEIDGHHTAPVKMVETYLGSFDRKDMEDLGVREEDIQKDISPVAESVSKIMKAKSKRQSANN